MSSEEIFDFNYLQDKALLMVTNGDSFRPLILRKLFRTIGINDFLRF